MLQQPVWPSCKSYSTESRHAWQTAVTMCLEAKEASLMEPHAVAGSLQKWAVTLLWIEKKGRIHIDQREHRFHMSEGCVWIDMFGIALSCEYAFFVNGEDCTHYSSVSWKEREFKIFIASFLYVCMTNPQTVTVHYNLYKHHSLETLRSFQTSSFLDKLLGPLPSQAKRVLRKALSWKCQEHG